MSKPDKRLFHPEEEAVCDVDETFFLGNLWLAAAKGTVRFSMFCSQI